MPINVNTFIQQANTAADNTKFYVQGENLSQQSHLSGLKKLSVSAHHAENNSAAQSFLTALSNDNRYANYLSQVRAPLDALISAHKPLTAGVVRETMQNLELAQNLEHSIDIGKNLAFNHKIPQGHGTSFGQFAVVRDLPLDTQEDLQKAVKEYLLEQVVSRDEANFTKLPDLGSDRKNLAAAKIIRSLSQPLTGQDGFFAKQIDTQFEAGFDSFLFENFAAVYQTANSPTLAQLRDFPEDLAANIAHSSNPANTLQLFNEAKEAMPQKELSALLIHSHEMQIPLTEPESRANCISHYMVERQGTNAAESIMTAHNLPKEFASAIGHNPEVAANARKLLAENPGPGHVPTQERVTEALAQAAEAFTQKFETQLQEIKNLAENPICELKPPLSVETMPRYINSLLTGETIIQPLLADGIAIDEAFINALASHAEALNSATHSVRGEFGADDINNVAQNSIRILLAKHNINPSQYLEVMNRIENKFGKLASDFTAINQACQQWRLGSNSISFLSKGMTMYRALESYAQTLIPMLNHDQKVDLNLADVQELPPNTPEAQQREGELFLQYIEKNFQKENSLTGISLALHDFAVHSGLRMPELSEAQRAGLERDATFALSNENIKLTKAVLAEYLPSTGRAVENRTEAFTSLFAQLALEHDLTGIDINKLNLTAFTVPLTRALNNVMHTATAANSPVSAEALHKAVYDTMSNELTQLKTVLDAVDAAEGFTAEEKVNIKNTVQETNLRDTAAIFTLANGAQQRTFSSALVKGASPAANANQLGEMSLDLMEKYLNVRSTLPENFAGAEDAQTFMLSYALKNANLTNADALALFENLSSNAAQDVASTFNGLSDFCEDNPHKMMLMKGTPNMMNTLRTLAETQAKGNSYIDALFFSGSIEGAHQIPGGPDGIMGMVQSKLGKSIIPDSFIPLSDHVPPYNAQEWKALTSLIDRLNPTIEHPTIKFLMPSIISNASAKILSAMDQNGEIQTKDLWKALVGSSCPSKVTENNVFETAYKTLYINYAKQYKKACPNANDSFIQQMFMSVLKLGFSAEKLIELAKPKASISLDNISYSVNMSSLRDYHENNAFGLVTDFRRKDKHTVLSFENVAGNSYSLHPFDIPDSENKPDHPEFVKIMDTVRNMTHSEAQFRRVMQAYSQAALVNPRIFSMLFPGVQYSEHGNFQISAKEQADGSVIVDIKTDETQPLPMHEQFRIETDGSHTCTIFKMSRPGAH